MINLAVGHPTATESIAGFLMVVGFTCILATFIYGGVGLCDPPEHINNKIAKFCGVLALVCILAFIIIAATSPKPLQIIGPVTQVGPFSFDQLSVINPLI